LIRIKLKNQRKHIMDKIKDLKLLIIFHLKDKYYAIHNLYDKLSTGEMSRTFDLLSGFAKKEVQT